MDHPGEVADFFRVFTGDKRFARIQEAVAEDVREGRKFRMCDLIDKAEAKGEVKERVKSIRKKMQKNFSVEEAADALEQEETDVAMIYELIRENPEFSDSEIAKIVITKKREVRDSNNAE